VTFECGVGEIGARTANGWAWVGLNLNPRSGKRSRVQGGERIGRDGGGDGNRWGRGRDWGGIVIYTGVILVVEARVDVRRDVEGEGACI
jgi:hypothetical protein